jgi:hypothetical protein
MRHPLLALTAVTLLAACSKPAPEAGAAPTPAVTTTTDSTAVPAAATPTAAVPDSAAKMSTDSMTPAKDSLMPDSTTGK